MKNLIRAIKEYILEDAALVFFTGMIFCTILGLLIIGLNRNN